MGIKKMNLRVSSSKRFECSTSNSEQMKTRVNNDYLY